MKIQLIDEFSEPDNTKLVVFERFSVIRETYNKRKEMLDRADKKLRADTAQHMTIQNFKIAPGDTSVSI